MITSSILERKKKASVTHDLHEMVHGNELLYAPFLNQSGRRHLAGVVTLVLEVIAAVRTPSCEGYVQADFAGENTVTDGASHTA